MEVEKLSKTYEYTPTAQGNDKLPASERVQVIIKRPTFCEMQELKRWKLDTQTSTTFYDIDAQRALKQNVVSIKNLKVGGDAITTGAQMCEAVELLPLIDDIAGEIVKDRQGE